VEQPFDGAELSLKSRVERTFALRLSLPGIGMRVHKPLLVCLRPPRYVRESGSNRGDMPYLHVPAGVYCYVQMEYGRITEESRITVVRRGAGVIIYDATVGALGRDSFSSHDSMHIGTDLAPKDYSGRYRLRQWTSTARATLSDGSATAASNATGGRPRKLALIPSTHHFVVIAAGLFGGIFMLPAQLHAWSASAVTALEPSLARTEILSTTAKPLLPRPANVPEHDGTFTVEGRIPFTVWYDRATFIIDEVVVPSRHATVARLFAFARGLSAYRARVKDADETEVMIERKARCSRNRLVVRGNDFDSDDLT